MKLSWLVLQLSDSALPTGGFAHSGGLEAAVQQAEVRTAGELRRFVRDAVWQAGYVTLPLASAAHADPAALPRLDARADAFLVSCVANRASRTQGRAFLETCTRIFPAEMTALRESARRAGLSLHYAPVAGAVLRNVGVERTEAQQLLLSLALRGVLFAAVRLGVAGTHEAQRLQHELAPLLEDVLAACAELSANDVAQTAPVADLFGSTHDRLYSRLFLS
jgi:urease accessory protein